MCVNKYEHRRVIIMFFKMCQCHMTEKKKVTEVVSPVHITGYRAAYYS